MCAVSFAFAQREFIPMTAGAACESGLDQFGQLSILQGVTNPLFASNPHIYQPQPVPNLGAFLTHSKSDWQIVLQKFKKAIRLIFFCRSQRCGPEQTSVQALQLFGFAIARRKRAPGVGRTRDHRDTPLGSRFKPDLKSGLAWKPPRFAAGVFFCGNRIDNRRRMLSTWNQGKR